MTRDLSVPRPIDEPAPVPLAPNAALDGLDDAKILAAPADPAQWPAWRDAIEHWRSDAARRIGYAPTTYDSMPEWTAGCRSVCLVWLWDERLYDRETGRFTVDDFLAAGEREYGGFDAVVLWHAYPVIGLDPRNQWDFYRDVPDLRAVVARFHEHGVRVFVDYNPWDTGTRRAAGSDVAELADLVDLYTVDGVFLDTLKTGAPELVDALAGVALEGESRLPLTAVADHALSWAQWFADSAAPGVLRAHWFERRHMMHHTRRWHRDHSAELQSAWVNGCGVLVWDDVFGVWVGWCVRDRATLRAMRQLQRMFHDHFVAGAWTPLANPHPDAVAEGVYAHRYVLGAVTVWTVVNRGRQTYAGPVLSTPDTGSWFELAYGAEVSATAGTVATRVPARSIACLVRVTGAVPSSIANHVPGEPADDVTFPSRPTRPAVTAPLSTGAPTPGAITVPAGDHRLEVRYRRRETGQFDEVRWVNAWKPLPPELHEIVTETRTVRLTPAAVDTSEVTNADYHRFLTATGYRPVVGHRFLAHWHDGAPALGTEHEPVTHVDLTDARAYAAWRGARLPSPAEWQAAAARGAGRAEPLVWNWTAAEYTDGITRFALLKGGSWFQATGSDWYVDGGPREAEWELKLVLPGGGLDRSPCVGFRCSVDLRR